MYPSTLLADPSLRLAGVQFRAHQPRSRGIVRGRRSTQFVSRERRNTPRRRRRWSWLAVAAVIAIAVGGLAYLRVWPPLATVMSASMSPTIKTGDIVVLKKLNRPARVGDIVAISVPEKIRVRYGYPPVVIHRVVKIDTEDVVTTKGDAYKEADPFDVPRSALTTKVVATVPAAGRLLAFLGSGLGLVWLVGGVLLFVGMPLIERYRESQRREFGERESLESTLRAVTDGLALLHAEQRPLADLDLAHGDSATSVELRAPAAASDAVASELRAMAAALADRDAVAAEERRALATAAAEREAALVEELRAFNAAAAEREAAAAETLRAVTASFTECIEATDCRATTAEEQLRAHLEQLPGQIERAVALALAAHVPAPPPPPPGPTRSSRFVAASHWDAPAPEAPAAWDARSVLSGIA